MDGEDCRKKQGWFLPVSQAETELQDEIRGFIYCSLMLYCFVGVGILADVFMTSIEVITSAKKKVRRKDGRQMTVRVWNEIVATLSLMALGSSAPEIFLSVMDSFKNKFVFTKLGAATIVGSAAFNLLVIVAVCVIAIPSDEIRQVEDLQAFFITAAFSILAYCWLVVILVICSPDIVDLWEALLTLSFLFLLVYLSYKANAGTFDSMFEKLGIAAKEIETNTGEGLFASFAMDSLDINSSRQYQTLDVVVQLPKHFKGSASVSYRTEAFTAVPCYDFVPMEGQLQFPEGVTKQRIPVQVLPSRQYRTLRTFLVVLEEPEGGIEFDPDGDGGPETAICSVAIVPTGEGSFRCLDSIMNIDALFQAKDEWMAQIVASIYCNGSLEESWEAGVKDWAVHLLALPWKLSIAILVPPPCLYGGWACFSMSLGIIAIQCALLSDLAESFGCVTNLPSIVTAITFVALGTSMPDLFASLLAAQDDPTADASIVNVTGSNSVNVFLGLGLPWTLGALHWNLQGKSFRVDSTNLGFSVLVFVAACLVTLFILYLRRKIVGGELGGPFVPKVTTFIALIAFWLGFVATVSWRVLRWGKYTNIEYLSVVASATVVELFFAALPLGALFMHWRRAKTCSFEEDPSQQTIEACEATSQDTPEVKGDDVLVHCAADEAPKKGMDDDNMSLSSDQRPISGEKPAAQVRGTSKPFSFLRHHRQAY